MLMESGGRGVGFFREETPLDDTCIDRQIPCRSERVTELKLICDGSKQRPQSLAFMREILRPRGVGRSVETQSSAGLVCTVSGIQSSVGRSANFYTRRD